jgi:hypothetical protein
MRLVQRLLGMSCCGLADRGGLCFGARRIRLIGSASSRGGLHMQLIVEQQVHDSLITNEMKGTMSDACDE